MMSVADLREWLADLPSDAQIAVDDGGLTLVVVDDGPPYEDRYIEIGGVPVEGD